jgi:hypothetical protein
MKKLIEITWFWVIPFGGLLALGFYQANNTILEPDIFLFRLLYPTLMMYFVVGLGAGYFKLWAFRVPYTLAGVLPQIGLVYSVVCNALALGLQLFLGEKGFLFVLCMALGGGLLGCWYDIPIVRHGLLWVKVQENRPELGAWAVVKNYGPLFFSAIGLLGGLGFVIAEHVIESSGSAFCWAVLFALVSFLPFAIYFYSLLRKKPINAT